MEKLKITDINFPIYGITNNRKKIWEEYNILYIETLSGIYILDNKNMNGNTLGERRIKINNSKLYKPRQVCYNIIQLIKSKFTTFIDSTGKVFTYKKSKFVPLKYYKVTNIIRSKDGECIISIPKINFVHKIACRKAYSIEYIGILHTDYGLVLYEYSNIEKKDTKRKI